LQARDFSDVYPNWGPEFTFFYEYQPWHSETWGEFGVVASAGVSFFTGAGKFKFGLSKGCVPPAPCNNPGTFSEHSDTNFQFWQFPVMAGVDYRFNLLNFLRRFVLAGPMALGYWENRNDNISGSTGFSKCLLISAGVNILLDGIAPGQAWDLYMEHGVKHF